MTNLLVEGGGRVLGSFLDAGQVDEVDVYVAPILEGGDHRVHAGPGPGGGSDERGSAARVTSTVDVVDRDVRMRGILPNPWRSIMAQLGTAGDDLTPLTSPGSRNYSQDVMAWILLRPDESSRRLPS